MECLVKILNRNATVPSRAYPGDAGYDLYSVEDVSIGPNAHVDVPTGIAIAPESGYWMRIVGRSSTSKKLGLHVIEGIIDNGYRGELFVRVHNPGAESVNVPAGSRLAQMIPHKLIAVDFKVGFEDLPPSDRGSNGFGSSGR